jgi:hypothetical protein
MFTYINQETEMTESPKYEVIKKQEDFELRRYAGYIQAEVDLQGRDYRNAIERGFNVLASYIFGNNTARQKMDMTTPVTVNQAQKIAMTTPVTVSGKDHFTVAFIMPSGFTLETLPVPRDQEIRFNQFPPHKMAVIRFSGYFNQGRIESGKQRLSEWLKQEGLEAEGEFVIAGYNPPWVPGFLARNEVMIRVRD